MEKWPVCGWVIRNGSVSHVLTASFYYSDVLSYPWPTTVRKKYSSENVQLVSSEVYVRSHVKTLVFILQILVRTSRDVMVVYWAVRVWKTKVSSEIFIILVILHTKDDSFVYMTPNNALSVKLL